MTVTVRLASQIFPIGVTSRWPAKRFTRRKVTLSSDSGGLVVRVYQAFATEQYGWDTNKEPLSSARPLHDSRLAAEKSADESLRGLGHMCDDGCYGWRALM
jgi:hypothetical protein